MILLSFRNLTPQIFIEMRLGQRLRIKLKASEELYTSMPLPKVKMDMTQPTQSLTDLSGPKKVNSQMANFTAMGA